MSETENQEQEPTVEEQQEIALGGTPAGKATNEMLRALARTARNYTK